MTYLVDTDVLIDVALAREPHFQASAEVLDLLEKQAGRGFVAWHTLSNFYYLVSSDRGELGPREFLVDLCRFMEVAETGTESLLYAADLDMNDFEDALQVAAAAACGAQAIVTRNP